MRTRRIWSRGTMMLGGVAVTAAMVLTGCSGGSASSDADGDDALSISVAVGGVDASVGLLWIAQDLGYFDDENLDVEIVINTGTTAVATGQAQLAYDSTAGMIPLVIQGKDAIDIYQTSRVGAGLAVIANADIDSADECEVWASWPQTTVSYGYTQLFIDGFGGDGTIQTFNDYGAMLSSLGSGQTDCTVASPGGAFAELESEGKVHTVLDASESLDGVPSTITDLDYAESVIYGFRDVIEENAAAVTRFLSAIDKAGDYVVSHSGEELAAVVADDEDWADQTAEAIAESFDLNSPYADVHGAMDPDLWNDGMLELMQKSGIEGMDDITDEIYSFENRTDSTYFSTIRKHS